MHGLVRRGNRIRKELRMGRGGEGNRLTKCTVIHVEAVTSRPPYLSASFTFAGIECCSRDWRDRSVSSLARSLALKVKGRFQNK